MNLIIDIGNSKTKIALFKDNNIKKSISVFYSDIVENLPINKELNVIVSSVKILDSTFIDVLKKRYKILIFLRFDTKLPLKNRYTTPKTLGLDRIASAVGANFLKPNSNLLIIDAGTALTIDFVNDKNEFLGGNISPGIEMRFKALNTFTDKLPLIEKDYNLSLFGDSTESAIKNGVINGIMYEINGTISEYSKDFTKINTFLTGGDSFFFDKLLKNNIFANSNLVLIGLNRILEYNLDDKEI